MKLFTIFRSSKDDIPDDVAADEIICRYLDEKNRFSPKNRIVKKKAFEPDNQKCLSVYRNSGLKHKEIIDIGETYVTKPKNKTLYGWGKFHAQEITDTKLDIISLKKPHFRHADLTGWPSAKHEIMDIQIELASKAELVLCGDSVK